MAVEGRLNLEDEFGHLYALVKQQMPAGDCRFNEERLWNFMEVVRFFDVLSGEEDGSWREIRFSDDENSGIVSMSFVYLGLESDRLRQMKGIFGVLDEFSITRLDADRFCVTCKLNDVFEGKIEDSSAADVPPELILGEEFHFRERLPEEQETELLSKLGKAMNDYLDSLDDTGFVENPQQMEKFGRILDFFRLKAKETGGSVTPILEPKTCVASLTSEFPEFVLRREEIQGFFKLLADACVCDISCKLNGNLSIELNVSDAFMPK